MSAQPHGPQALGAAPPVVAGVDGSRDAQDAARLAALEARRRGAPLRLVLVLPGEHRHRPPAPERLDGRAVTRLGADLVLGSLEAAVREAAPGVDVGSELLEGRPVDVLVERSRSARLLCVGSTSTGTVTDVLLGSTASAVARHARCPVLVVPRRPGTSVTGRSGVVVGVDGGPGDDEVLEFAARAAADRGTSLVAVHTWRHRTPGIPHVLVDPLGSEVTARRREESLLEDALDRVAGQWPDVPVRRVVERAPAAATLVAAALTAELLVVGHRHRRGTGALRSVTTDVLHRAACPVAVLPVPAGDRGPAG